MRILHFTESMASGVLKYLQEVTSLNGLNCNEHIILYSTRETTPDNLTSIFPESVTLKHVNLKFSNFLNGLLSIYKAIKEIQPDIIHLHSSIAGFLGRLVTILFPKIKVYYTPHGYSFLMTNKWFVYRGLYLFIEFILSNIKGSIIACSKSEYRYGNVLSLFRKAYIVENCINPNIFKNKASHSGKQIIGIGRMEEQKNPRLFIEIAAKIKEIDPKVQAVWIGDGTQMKECQQLNKKLNAGVVFTGWLSNEKTIEYVINSTVLIQTSKWEGLPYTMLEAFVMGIPVVASNIISHRDLMNNNYKGYIARNEQDFVSYTVSLIKQPELARNFAEYNIEKVKENYNLFSKNINYIYSSRE